jgi:pseudaminic acid biosynthesis-associated methylase
LPPKNIYGVDVNLKALTELRSALSEVNALWSPARELPFRDRWFDLVFTTGVLIHQPETTLPLVMREIVRCSRRYVLCGEYYAEHTTEIVYREQRGALFKRDYGRIYKELFPELRLCKQGFLGREQGWDDVTYWVFER